MATGRLRQGGRGQEPIAQEVRCRSGRVTFSIASPARRTLKPGVNVTAGE
jgi:hypothetical protein